MNILIFIKLFTFLIVTFILNSCISYRFRNSSSLTTVDGVEIRQILAIIPLAVLVLIGGGILVLLFCETDTRYQDEIQGKKFS